MCAKKHVQRRDADLLLVKNIAHVWWAVYSFGCESERKELQVAARIEETGEKERNILEF